MNEVKERVRIFKRKLKKLLFLTCLNTSLGIAILDLLLFFVWEDFFKSMILVIMIIDLLILSFVLTSVDLLIMDEIQNIRKIDENEEEKIEQNQKKAS